MDTKAKTNALVFLSIALNNAIKHGKVLPAEIDIIAHMLREEVNVVKHETVN